MKLRIRHTTVFSYDEPILEGYTEVRLKPRDEGGQSCLAFTLASDPQATMHAYRDSYDNSVMHFDMLASHDRLTLTACAEVQTSDRFDARPPELRERFDFLAPTGYVPFDDTIRAFAQPLRVPGDAAATAMRVMTAVRQRLRYATGATDVTTSADQALERGAGVCQDFAHLMLAACRLLDVPARYVSGYVYAPGSAAAAASHAWVDIYAESRGWLSLDPTHGTSQAARHVRVAVGRDYADVPPTRGVFKGNASETLAVEVAVEAL